MAQAVAVEVCPGLKKSNVVESSHTSLTSLVILVEERGAGSGIPGEEQTGYTKTVF